MNTFTSLSDLLSEQRNVHAFIEIHNERSRTFGQDTLSTTLPVSKLLSIYEVDLEVQRAINPHNLSKLMDYIMLSLENTQPIYFPGVILSARGAGAYDEHDHTYRLQAIEKLYVIDGQHRLAAFTRIMETLQSMIARAKDRKEYDKVEQWSQRLNKLYDFPLSVMIYLDINAREERQLFSDINKLPRKIGGNLSMLRDQRRFYHVVASKLAAQDEILKQIGVDVYSERGKGAEYLFSYALLVEIICGLFEGRLRTSARNNSYSFSEEDEAFIMKNTSFYFSKLIEGLPPAVKGEMAWTENIQIALALFFHEQAVKTGSFNRYALEHALKILPLVQWNNIYSGDESYRLPRRTRIIKALNYIKQVFEEHGSLLNSREEDAG